MPLKGEQLKSAMRAYLDEIRTADPETLTHRQKLMIEFGDNFLDLLLREERGRKDEPAVAYELLELCRSYRMGMRNGELIQTGK
ncbi:MAG: hypothetical protein KJZ84_24025 [Bryobacteraceae bacterium]|nr:hypothetical protein [Bryobacteraceae bacterium]